MFPAWSVGLLALAVFTAGCVPRLIPPPGYSVEQIARDLYECETEAELKGTRVIRKEDELWTMPDQNAYHRCVEARGYRFEHR